MEKVFALSIGPLSFGSLITFVARIEETFKHIFRFGDGISIDRAGFDDAHRAALNRAGDAHFVTTFRQDHIIESSAGNQGAGRRNTEAHRQRNRFLVLVVFGNYLPHV